MENLTVVRSDIHALADRVKDITVLKIIRNLLELELFEEEEMDLSFPEKLKQELDNRRELTLTHGNPVFTVSEVEKFVHSLRK